MRFNRIHSFSEVENGNLAIKKNDLFNVFAETIKVKPDFSTAIKRSQPLSVLTYDVLRKFILFMNQLSKEKTVRSGHKSEIISKIKDRAFTWNWRYEADKQNLDHLYYLDKPESQVYPPTVFEYTSAMRLDESGLNIAWQKMTENTYSDISQKVLIAAYFKDIRGVDSRQAKAAIKSISAVIEPTVLNDINEFIHFTQFASLTKDIPHGGYLKMFMRENMDVWSEGWKKKEKKPYEIGMSTQGTLYESDLLESYSKELNKTEAASIAPSSTAKGKERTRS